MRKSEYQNPKPFQKTQKTQRISRTVYRYNSKSVVSNTVLPSTDSLIHRFTDLLVYLSIPSFPKHFDLQRGQALITLLFFMIIAITITSAAVVVILTNSASAQKLEQGTTAYYVAESGAENGLLRLLRDPTYCGETLPIDSGTATITVTDGGGGCNGTSPITITSTGNMGNFSRKIQVIATYVSNILTVTSWKEVF